MEIIIGNIVALVASVVMVYSGIVNNRKKVIILQTIYTALFIVSDLLLDGFSGAIINTLSILRNILAYNDKLDTNSKIVISILAIITCIIYNNLGFVGLFPLISMILYLLFMNTKDIQKFKLLIIGTSFLWALYDLRIKLYTSFAFDMATIIGALITFIINDKKRKCLDGRKC